MRADIQADLLFYGRYTQSYTPVKQLGYHKGDPKTKDYGDRHGQELDAELLGIAEKQAVGAVTVDRYCGEKTGGYRAQGARDTVTCPHIKGLIQFASVPKTHGIIGQRRGYCSDKHSRQRRYKA